MQWDILESPYEETLIRLPEGHDFDDTTHPYYGADVIERSVEYSDYATGVHVRKQTHFYVFPPNVALEQGHEPVPEIPSEPRPTISDPEERLGYTTEDIKERSAEG